MIKTNDFTDYYTKRHANMIKQFEQWFRCVRKSAAPYITPEQSERVHEIALKEYETLIPEIPYIGGKKVAGTRNLVGSVILLAYIRAFEKEGLSERVIGEIVYKSFDAFFARIPAVFGTLTGKLMFVPWYVKKRKKTMEKCWLTIPNRYQNMILHEDIVIPNHFHTVTQNIKINNK